MTEEKPPAGDFDDLLGDLPSAEEKDALQNLKDEGSPDAGTTDPAAAARIASLEERLERALALLEAKDEVPEKTAAEKDAEHRRAIEISRNLTSGADKYEDPSEYEEGEILEIHFLDDGITSNGRVWEKGQTVQYVIGGRAYNETKDRNGRTWLEHLSHNEQLQRWGRIRVGFGPYPLALPEDHVNPEEAKRGKRAPVLS
jgi:hypothetical protein